MSEYRKHQKAMVLELHNLSQTRKTCFCLRVSKKLDDSFGPWNDNCGEALHVSEKGRRNSYHICGGYLLDSKALPNRNPPKALHPKCSKNLPFSVGYGTTNYRRGQEKCVEKDFVAFQHQDSHRDYAKRYRMSKYRHTCAGSVVTAPNEEPQPSVMNPQIPGVHTKNFWTIKYDQKYMEDCCKPTLAESFKINPYAAFRSSVQPHQPSHSYKGDTTASTHEHKRFYTKISQNPVFSSSYEPVELDTVELCMQKNVVLYHRNSSAFANHFKGFFTQCNRHSHSQQTSRQFLALGRAAPRVRYSSQIFIGQPGRADETLLTLQNWEKPRQQNQIYLDQHYQFRPCADHSRFYPGNVKGNYMHTDVKNQENVTTRSPFLSKATLFSSESSTNTKDALGTTLSGSSSQVKFPKLPDKCLDRNLMQSSSALFPDAGSKQGLLTSKAVVKSRFPNSPSTAKYLYRTSEEKQEETSSTIVTAKLNSNDDDGSNSKCPLEFNGGLCIKMPKKWEDEYLDHIPPKISAISPQPQRLFSLESVNKRLLEHGIGMQVEDKGRTAHMYSKHEKYLEEDKHFPGAHDGIEGALNTLQMVKQNTSKRVKKGEWHRHKEKRRPKVRTGQSGSSTTSTSPQQRAYKHRGAEHSPTIHIQSNCNGE